jgi:hypothetical protein
MAIAACERYTPEPHQFFDDPLAARLLPKAQSCQFGPAGARIVDRAPVIGCDEPSGRPPPRPPFGD